MSNPNESLFGSAEFVDPFSMQLEADEGDGFIHCISLVENPPATTWSIEGDSRERAMEEEVPWPEGTFTLKFTVASPHRPPPPITDLVVRAGLGTIVLVDYNGEAKATS